MHHRVGACWCDLLALALVRVHSMTLCAVARASPVRQPGRRHNAVAKRHPPIVGWRIAVATWSVPMHVPVAARVALPTAELSVLQTRCFTDTQTRPSAP
jgi:hypothetical protein